MFISHPLLKEGSIESRAYQDTIVKTAKDANTLVVAPTALGKTIIALLVALHYLIKHPGKKILILAPTRPLAAQHYSSFKEFTLLDKKEIALLTGNNAPEKRGDIWNKARIVCATPHVILNDFDAGRYLPGEVSLAVFDEAHRSSGDYPYPGIAKLLDCRILALTASPGGEIEKINDVRKNLKIEKVEIRDEQDPDVEPYVKGMNLEWRIIKLPEPYWVIRNLLKGLIKERIKVIRKVAKIENTANNVKKKELLELMIKLQKKASLSGEMNVYQALSAVSTSLTLSHAIDLLETQGISPLASYLTRTEKKAASPRSSKGLKRLVLNRDFKRVQAMTEHMKMKYSDPKMEELKKIIMETKRETRIIIFTQFRDTAKDIVENLNDVQGVRAIRFVGQASREGDKGLSQKEQLELLEGFGKGDFNILVATSVAEEGLDIPAVDIVIFHEPVPSEIRMIQRRGRTGRSRAGRVIVFMAKGTRDEGTYWSSVSRENRMKKSLRRLKGPSIQRDFKKSF